jgi:hypothetical protein
MTGEGRDVTECGGRRIQNDTLSAFSGVTILPISLTVLLAQTLKANPFLSDMQNIDSAA